MQSHDYEKTIRAKHRDRILLFDPETQEYRDVTGEPPKNPDQLTFEPQAMFTETYKKTWDYLLNNLTALEYFAASKLANKATAFTNSLEPLSDNSQLRDVAKALGISLGKVKSTIDRFKELGVIVQPVENDKPYSRYWVISPYLWFNGKRINKAIPKLFEGTLIEKHFHSKT